MFQNSGDIFSETGNENKKHQNFDKPKSEFRLDFKNEAPQIKFLSTSTSHIFQVTYLFSIIYPIFKRIQNAALYTYVSF